MNYEALNNDELLNHFAKTRDEAAFQVFHDRNTNGLRGFLYNICHVTPQDISDCLQSVWVRVVDKVHLYDPEQSAILWLHALAKNVKNNLWHQSTTLSRGGIDIRHSSLGDRRFAYENLITDYRTNQTVSDPSAQMIQEEQHQQINKAIEKLPSPQREAVTMVLLDGTPYDQAAERVGVPTIVFAQRLSRGKKSLYRLLSHRKDELVGK